MGTFGLKFRGVAGLWYPDEELEASKICLHSAGSRMLRLSQSLTWANPLSFFSLSTSSREKGRGRLDALPGTLVGGGPRGARCTVAPGGVPAVFRKERSGRA